VYLREREKKKNINDKTTVQSREYTVASLAAPPAGNFMKPKMTAWFSSPRRR